ncbi:hypothetical protein MUY14_28910 [Amycolatopsis sp. FBCC-B4732]|uniref:hypothetical protein n=1 Tax=Amycolatopsis sp. FBCC-B4732 TaxID=3079339 RepID=UPI001FF66158|nr:hypothetical protein [Amycolatopsis sp. FBCC-B4732]UOX85788.1 hypothetical protein MUY14_28910 [Amycolatopsis sp. FBCC-B4732]
MAGAAAVVRARRPGPGPLEALREAFLRGLDERAPVTGLCDEPGVPAGQRFPAAVEAADRAFTLLSSGLEFA